MRRQQLYPSSHAASAPRQIWGTRPVGAARANPVHRDRRPFSWASWRNGSQSSHWEKAARGVDARAYPWGDAPEPDCAYTIMDDNGPGCGTGTSWPVHSTIGASPYGVQDMGGNISEWVADWYGPYDPDDLDNPAGPSEGMNRVQRGASWGDADPAIFRTAARADYTPGTRPRWAIVWSHHRPTRNTHRPEPK